MHPIEFTVVEPHVCCQCHIRHLPVTGGKMSHRWLGGLMATFDGNNQVFGSSSVDTRAAFIMRTYTHVVGGILAFILIELGLFESGLAQQIFMFMVRLPWLLILGAFMLVGWLATHTAQTSSNIRMQ